MLAYSYSYNSFQITLLDFILIFLTELFFFAFIKNKLKVADIWPILLMSSLLKVGFLSLVISWLPSSIHYSFKAVVFFTSLLIFSGSIITSIVLQKEFAKSREDSFNTGFQLSFMSSILFFTVKILLMPSFYGNITQSITFASAGGQDSIGLFNSNFAFFSNSGGFLVLFGIVGVVYYSKKKLPSQIKN